MGFFDECHCVLDMRGQLPNPSDMIAREVIGLPLLMMRDRGGDIGVFLNVCRHRGARLLVEQEHVAARTP